MYNQDTTTRSNENLMRENSGASYESDRYYCF